MPQRFLRPGIRTSEAWNSVDWVDQSAYIRLLTLVDDEGRYDGRLPVLHAELWALRDDVTRQLTAAIGSRLEQAGLIRFYEVDGKRYVQVTKWQERARNRSKFPSPPDDNRLPSAAIGCHRLPPSPSPSPSPSRAPSDARAHEGGQSIEAEIPSWEEWWAYCQSPTCGLGSEAYAKDKWLAAEADNWKGKANWRAYAARCRTWWEQDGRPMATITRVGPTLAQVQSYATEKGFDTMLGLVTRWHALQSERAWKHKDGRSVDWQVELSAWLARKREKEGEK